MGWSCGTNIKQDKFMLGFDEEERIILKWVSK
jgi:hypothetical protein